MSVARRKRRQTEAEPLRKLPDKPGPVADGGDPDQLPANVAILNELGFIVDVNDSWKTFARDNGFRAADFGIGLNYLDVCRGGAVATVEFGDQLQRLLNAEINLINLAYTCDSPKEPRWFSLIALPLTDRRVAVMHIELSRIVQRPLTASIESYSENMAKAIRCSVSKSLRLQFARMGTEKQPRLDAAYDRSDRRDPSNVSARLTKRQQEILSRLGRGETNGEIARALFRSPHTIKLHVSAILKRLDLQNRTQAALLASRIFRDAP